jgi:hypothetical protein
MGSAPWEEREVNDDEAVVMVSGGGYRPAADGRARVGSGGLGCPIPPYKGGRSAPTLGQTDLEGESEFYHTQTPAPQTTLGRTPPLSLMRPAWGPCGPRPMVSHLEGLTLWKISSF